MADTGSNKKSKSSSRRDMENAVFNELAELLPISQDAKQDRLSILRMTVAYLRLQESLQADMQDLEECLSATRFDNDDPFNSDNNSTHSSQPPLAMLDNEGNLIAGSLRKEPAESVLEPNHISLPETVISRLEEQFLAGSEFTDAVEAEARKEKLRNYQEGLERGMQEFLYQDFVELQGSSVNSGKGTRHIQTLDCVKRRNDIKWKKVSREHPQNSADVSVRKDEMVAKMNDVQEGKEMLKAMAGFILLLDGNLRILYVSENVSDHLGYSQFSMIGQDISEFVYDKDYPELERHTCSRQFQMESSGYKQSWRIRRTFYLAMKFCFQKSGSRTKDTGFQLYQWNVKLRLCKNKVSNEIKVIGLIALCCPLVRDILLSFSDNPNFFMIRFSIKDSKILYCDPKVQDFLGYKPSELVGVKHSHLKHPSDVLMCKFNYRNLPEEGKSESGYYRMLSRTGSWVWMFSKLNIIYNKAGKPEVLVMRSIIVSQAEAECVLSRERKHHQQLTNLNSDEDPMAQQLRAWPCIASVVNDTHKKRKMTFVEMSENRNSRILSGASLSSSSSLSSENVPTPDSASCLRTQSSEILLNLSSPSVHDPTVQHTAIISEVHELNKRMLATSTHQNLDSGLTSSVPVLTPEKLTSQQNVDPVLSPNDYTYQSLSHNVVAAGWYVNTDSHRISSSSFTLPDSFTNLSHQKSSIQRPHSQQIHEKMSQLTPSFSPSPLNSSSMEWSLDSFLFGSMDKKGNLPTEVNKPDSDTAINRPECDQQLSSPTFISFDQHYTLGQISTLSGIERKDKCNERSSMLNQLSLNGRTLRRNESIKDILDILADDISSSNALVTSSHNNIILSPGGESTLNTHQQGQVTKSLVHSIDLNFFQSASIKDNEMWQLGNPSTIPNYSPTFSSLTLNNKMASMTSNPATLESIQIIKPGTDAEPSVISIIKEQGRDCASESIYEDCQLLVPEGEECRVNRAREIRYQGDVSVIESSDRSLSQPNADTFHELSDFRKESADLNLPQELVDLILDYKN